MSIFRRFFQGSETRAPLRPLYAAIVARGRQPEWYRQGAVPDTLDGRFDMIAAVLALVLIRLEAAGDAYRAPSTLVTELFVDDMDGQLRQAGIGDIVVGKHIGRMMAALGGRITAYREALAGNEDLAAALVRNLYRGEAPDEAALAFTTDRLRGFHEALAVTPAEAIIAGQLP
ncbi:ubiquinol-cytochrome C chaperone family protein [Sphingomonas solaris]|uniref:Ubiquinol-cytochrome C chaperone n=1 Tax=Alterirhizorhabdus solaris TaxID=2529389 RepID=A0A558R2X1_9SPHN|nr:ubiquinol-cytochrome C chaperone family protein [Sphingomonas solaris]TVV73692.1 ubiquinol-cytochrome C chaperone [Sphingomonas solaris]